MELIEKERKNWHHLNDEEERKLSKLLSSGCLNNRRLLRYKDTKFATSENYLPVAERIRTFKIRPSDVWIMTYPKSGTNWMSEIAWQIEHGVKPDCDGVDFLKRIPGFERDVTTFDINGKNIFADKSVRDYFDMKPMQNFDRIDQTEGTRVIKSHLPMCLAPPDLLGTAKIIYVARNPKDVAVSAFHYHDNQRQFWGKIEQGFDDYADCFRQGLEFCGDYFFHVSQAYELRNHPNVLFVWFEDMKRDTLGVVSKVAEFMGKDLDRSKLEQLAEMVQIENIKKNPYMNTTVFGPGFIRTGKVGDGKKYFKDEKVLLEFDNWIRENVKKYNMKEPVFEGYF